LIISLNGEGDGAGHKKDPPADLRTIGKRFESFVHGPPRGGEGDERSDPDKHREVFAEQADDADDPGAGDLADPDLLSALLSSIGDETEKPKAGDQDGKDGEGDEDLAGLLVGMIQFIKVVIHEGVAEGQELVIFEVTLRLLYSFQTLYQQRTKRNHGYHQCQFKELHKKMV